MTVKRKAPGDPAVAVAEQESSSASPEAAVSTKTEASSTPDTDSWEVVEKQSPMQSPESIPNNDDSHQKTPPSKQTSTNEAASHETTSDESPVVPSTQSAEKEETHIEETETNHVDTRSQSVPVSQKDESKTKPLSATIKESIRLENTPQASVRKEAPSDIPNESPDTRKQTPEKLTPNTAFQRGLDELSFPDSTPGSKVQTPSPTKDFVSKQITASSDAAENPSPLASPKVLLKESERPSNETTVAKSPDKNKTSSVASESVNTVDASSVAEGKVKPEESPHEEAGKTPTSGKAPEAPPGTSPSTSSPLKSSKLQKATATPLTATKESKTKTASSTIKDFFTPKSSKEKAKSSPKTEEASKSETPASSSDSDTSVLSPEISVPETPPMKLSLLGCYKASNFVQRLCVLKGSVLDFGTDPYLVNPTSSAIVNAANEGCLGGGGVDGAISTAGGEKLYKARVALPLLQRGIRCPTGTSVLTSASENFGSLHVRNVIHAVGPNYHLFDEEDEEHANRLLRSAYATSLQIAHKNRIQNVGFSLLSAGIFRGQLTMDEVLTIGLQGIQNWKPSAKDEEPFVPHVYLCAFTPRECRVLLNTCDRMFTKIEDQEAS